MGQVGRKAKEGKRVASGRLSREGASEAKAISPAALMRLREKAIAGACDPLWGSPLGQMHLRKEITLAQLEAGKRWGNLAKQYRSAIGAKPLRAMNIGGGGSGFEPDPDTPAGQDIAESDRRAMADYDKAQIKLLAKGDRVATAVAVLCEDDRPLSWEDRRVASEGLSALADHWGLTKSLN